MTSVSLFQFSLCFKSPRTPQKCGVFVCPFFWLFGCLILPQIAHASKTVELQANLESKLSAVEQIKARFGKYSIESPIHTLKHGGIKFDHIGFVKDAELGNAFIFSLRRDIDGDRDKIWPKGKERQRIEIKGYQSSPDLMKGKYAENHLIQWYLKIDKDFRINKEFCHFFQLKAVGNKNVDAPVLTLSGVTDQGKPQLQLQWWTSDESGRVFLTEWEECKNKWLRCECKVNYAKNGSIDFSLRSLDGVIDLKKQLKNLQTWRDGFDFVRPKWGIYRSLAKERDKLNPQDQIRMNNFSIQKL
jgi:hypothetical protein